MKLRTLALSALILAGSAGVGLALADQGKPHHEGFHGPQAYTEDSTRTFADGKTFKRHVEQTVNANGFAKTETLTNPEGKSATRKVTASFDKTNHTWSRAVQGTGFDGKSYSSNSQGQGFEGHHGHFHGGFGGGFGGHGEE